LAQQNLGAVGTACNTIRHRRNFDSASILGAILCMPLKQNANKRLYSKCVQNFSGAAASFALLLVNLLRGSKRSSCFENTPTDVSYTVRLIFRWSSTDSAVVRLSLLLRRPLSFPVQTDFSVVSWDVLERVRLRKLSMLIRDGLELLPSKDVIFFSEMERKLRSASLNGSFLCFAESSDLVSVLEASWDEDDLWDGERFTCI